MKKIEKIRRLKEHKIWKVLFRGRSKESIRYITIGAIVLDFLTTLMLFLGSYTGFIELLPELNGIIALLMNIGSLGFYYFFIIAGLDIILVSFLPGPFGDAYSLNILIGHLIGGINNFILIIGGFSIFSLSFQYLGIKEIYGYLFITLLGAGVSVAYLFFRLWKSQKTKL